MLQVSIINDSLAAELDLESVPCSIEVLSFSKSRISNVRMTKFPVTVQIGSAQIIQHFLICTLNEPLVCILGTDAFEKLNLFIGGIKLHNTNTEEVEILETNPIMQFNVRASREIQDQIELGIRDSLIENELNTKGFCNIPNALVHLPTIHKDSAWVKQYPISQSLSEVVDNQVSDWLKESIIEPAPPGCCWNSSLIVVKKKLSDGSIKHRVCVDPRHINVKLLDDKFPIPVLRTLLDRTVGSQFFSALDLKNSYHQFPIALQDRQKTAFTWRGVQYMFSKCPFGLKTSTSVFQRVMTELFSDLEFVICYVDDVIISSSSVQDHIAHLKIVINRISEANLTLNSKKCLFGYQKLHVLGHIISNEGIQVDSTKFEDVQNVLRPTSSRDIQAFLRLMNYFRDFLPNFAKISKPLDSLRNVDQKDFLWTKNHELAFNSLKECFFKAPILSPPDYKKEFFIATDASSFAIGSVLFQLKNINTEKSNITTASSDDKLFIKFCSRSLKKSELNYPACKRELLGIVFAFKKFEHYVSGQKITIFTDSKPLSFLMSQKHLSNLHYAWLETILSFNFDIFYCPGKVNILPDLLSRLAPDFKETNVALTAALTVDPTTPPAQTDVLPTRSEVLALKMGLNLVPAECQSSLLADHHSLTHCRSRELYSRVVQSGNFWLSLRKDCDEFTKSCNECRKFTISKHGFNPQCSIMANLPMDHVLVDLLGPLPLSENNPYLLICIDVFSRFIFLKPLTDKKAESVAKALLFNFYSFRSPQNSPD